VAEYIRISAVFLAQSQSHAAPAINDNLCNLCITIIMALAWRQNGEISYQYQRKWLIEKNISAKMAKIGVIMKSEK